MPRVADFIQKNRELLVERFLTEASQQESAQGVSPYELIDTFPEYLLTLATLSRQRHRGDVEQTRQRIEETHISLRLKLGYSLKEVTNEYVLIGRLISSLWENLPPEEHPPAEDLQLLFNELQSAMDQVVETFIGYTLEQRQHEKRTLRRLDTIASEVIGDMEGSLLLRERLGALVEVVQGAVRADAASLMLVDPDGLKLLPTVHTGRWSTVEEREPFWLEGDSFAAQVAAAEEPLALPDASVSASVSQGERHSGVRSLLGLRLWPHGRLVGVLYVGMMETQPFAPQERRFFQILAEYLAGIIEKALLLQQTRETHQRLVSSETRYRLATQSISDAVWDWNLLTNSVSWSEGVEKLLGYTPEQLGTQFSDWSSRIHPEDRERLEPGLHEFLEGKGERWRDEYRFLHRNGTYIYVIDHGVLERDAHGKGIRMVGAMQDITASKAASEALRASEDRLLLTLRAAEFGTWDFNPITGTLQWDERCKELFGVPPDTVVNFDAFHSVIHPEDRDRAVAAVQLALSGQSGGDYDIEFRTQRTIHGTEQWIRAIGRAYFEGGRAVRFIGTVQDVSERKHREAETQQNTKFTEQLIGIVSHDLRSPLNAITLAASALMRSETLDERQAKGLARISSAADRANRLIHDLLDFTRARLGGGIPVQPQPLDIHLLTQQTVEEVHLSWPEREILVMRQGPGQGEWDGDRLAQVVTNLVNNALAYSPKGTPVRVETRGEESSVELRVHNLGDPIPEHLLPSIFQPLTRGEKRGSSGSRSIGLGLYIVSHIVRAHGGSISVRSTAEEGTTFTACLPRRPSAPQRAGR